MTVMDSDPRVACAGRAVPVLVVVLSLMLQQQQQQQQQQKCMFRFVTNTATLH